MVLFRRNSFPHATKLFSRPIPSHPLGVVGAQGFLVLLPICLLVFVLFPPPLGRFLYPLPPGSLPLGIFQKTASVAEGAPAVFGQKGVGTSSGVAADFAEHLRIGY